MFNIDFQAGAPLPGTGVFSRASGAMALDHENIWRDALSGELRFRGLRRVENLFTASGTPATQTITVVVDARYAFYFRDGGGTGSYALTGAATATVTEGANEAFTFTATTTSLVCTLSGSAGAGSTVQLEETSGAAVNKPSNDYVDIDTTYNAEVDGVRYFTTDNTGITFTAPGPGAVTEAAGSSIAAATREGVLLEPAATNEITESDDLTNWSIRGTAAVNFNGVFSELTGILASNAGDVFLSLGSGTFSNGVRLEPSFVIQKVTSSASTEKIIITSAHASPAVGTWEIDIDLLSTGEEWITRDHPAVNIVDDFISKSNGAGGFIFRLTGTSETIDFNVRLVQEEERTFSTSPIRTTGSAATRVVDILTMPLARAAPWTMYQDCKPQITVDIATHALMGYVSGSNKAQIVRATTSYDGELDDGTDNPTANITDAAASYTMGGQLKVALSSVDGDQARMGLNGQSDEDTTGGVVDTVGFATVGIGMIQTGGGDIPITVRKAQLLSVAKTEAELATLTTI